MGTRCGGVAALWVDVIGEGNMDKMTKVGRNSSCKFSVKCGGEESYSKMEIGPTSMRACPKAVMPSLVLAWGIKTGQGSTTPLTLRSSVLKCD